MVEDHDKASGLELRQPQGAQAVGLVWPGEQGSLLMGPEGGQSRQAVVIPFNSGMLQVFAVFVFNGFPLVMCGVFNSRPSALLSSPTSCTKQLSAEPYYNFK